MEPYQAAVCTVCHGGVDLSRTDFDSVFTVENVKKIELPVGGDVASVSYRTGRHTNPAECARVQRETQRKAVGAAIVGPEFIARAMQAVHIRNVREALGPSVGLEWDPFITRRDGSLPPDWDEQGWNIMNRAFRYMAVGSLPDPGSTTAAYAA